MKYLRLLAIFLTSLLAVPHTASAQTGAALRLACFPTDSYGEAYYAQDMGFFKEARHQRRVRREQCRRGRAGGAGR